MGVAETTLFGMSHFASTLVYTTRFDEALEEAEKTLAKAKEHGHLKYQAEILTFAIPACHLRNGDVDSAMAALEKGMEIALQIGDRLSEALAAVAQGDMAVQRGSFDEAITLYNRAVAAGQATGFAHIKALGLCTIGTCYRRIGGPLLQRTLDLHAETRDVMNLPNGSTLGAWMWSEMGYASIQVGELDEAEELFQKALDEPTTPMWLIRPTALAGLADVAIIRGDLQAATASFEEMNEYVNERKMADRYLDVEMLGARLSAARGDNEAALSSLLVSESTAKEAGLKRILFDIHVLQQDIHRKQGNGGAADAATAHAREVGAEILSGIRDQELKSAFEAQIEMSLGR